MRPFFLAIAIVGSSSLLAGCATGLRAESNAPPLVLPDAAQLVRVRILYTRSPTRLDCTGPFQFQQRRGGNIYTSAQSLRLRASHGSMVFGQKSLKGEVLAMPVGSTDTLKINGRRYRGALVFHPLVNGLYDVIEYVNLDDYVYGVLPREVETNWPLDALKAQAVVSRTYALSSKLLETKGRFDVSDGVFDQVYGGLEVESAPSNQAVDETRGEVLVDSSGKPIEAFFHSSCGGRTEFPQNVWKSDFGADVYGSVADAFCQEDPHYKWELELSFETIRQRLRKAGIRLRDLKKIIVVKKSVSGRSEIIGLQTSRGVVEVSGNRFRLAMGADKLRSTLFMNIKQTKRSALFVGQGWGHGAGLCQWGARGRAAAGQTYKQILLAYYPGAKLEKK